MQTLIKIAIPSIVFLIMFSLITQLLFLLNDPLITIGPLSLKHDQGTNSYSTAQIAVLFIPVVVFLYSLYRLLCLFLLFKNEDFFSVDSISHLKWFSGLYLLSTLLDILLSGIVNAWASFDGGSDVMLKFDVPGAQISELGLAVVFFIIALILNEARQNKEALEGFF